MKLPENHSAAQAATVSINWLFFDKVKRPIRCTEMPRALFNGLVQDSAEFFVNEIRRHLRFNADLGTIEFWRTKEPLSMDAVGTSWKGAVSELEARASIIPGPRRFSKYLQEAVTNDDLIHLIITAEEEHARSNEDDERRYIANGLEKFGKLLLTTLASGAQTAANNGETCPDGGVVESEDVGDAQYSQEEEVSAALEEEASPPPLKKQKREQDEASDDSNPENDPEAIKVREWRHRLQKAFLSGNIPKEKDIPALDDLFSTVENYKSMSVAYLQFSKIGKVMRHIAILDDSRVPKDAEYEFRERAKALVDKWNDILNVRPLQTT